MPALLSDRVFPSLMQSQQLSPGFRQSPVAEQGVTICFARYGLPDMTQCVELLRAKAKTWTNHSLAHLFI